MLKRNMFLIITFLNFGRQDPNPAVNCYYQIPNNTAVNCPPGTVPLQMPQTQMIPSQPTAQQVKPTKVTTKITEGPKPQKTALDTLIEMNPEVGKSIKAIFEYNGIADPWPQFSDILNIDQHKLPDPKMLYCKMKDLLKVFESIKEMISDELVKIETYIKRAKAYLSEDQEILKRSINKMDKELRKIKEATSDDVKDEYAQKFTEERSKTNKTVDKYKKLRKWLVCTLSYFKALF